MISADPDQQQPILSFGFRPFFLFAGLYAVIVMIAWAAWLLLHSMPGILVSPSISGPPHEWHGHEMIFGYAVAVLSGFMLTAMPNWTGARRVAGAPLLGLAVLWLFGRLAMWFSAFLPPIAVAIADFAYLPCLGLVVALSLFVRPAARHLIFLLFIVLLAIANGAVHSEWLGLAEDLVRPALDASLLLLALMVTIIGGRIVPSFTRNALLRQGESVRLPESYPWLDRVAIIAVALLVPLSAFDIAGPLAGFVAIIAAAANLVRLAMWRSTATFDSPILWSLHLAYCLLALGFAVLAIAELTDAMSKSAALHFIAISGIGSMTLAVMTRAALGHTGRPLVVAHPIALAYVLLALAGVVRSIGITLFPQFYTAMLMTSAGIWIVAFAIFSAVYAPILLGPSKKPA